MKSLVITFVLFCSLMLVRAAPGAQTKKENSQVSNATTLTLLRQEFETKLQANDTSQIRIQSSLEGGPPGLDSSYSIVDRILVISYFYYILQANKNMVVGTYFPSTGEWSYGTGDLVPKTSSECIQRLISACAGTYIENVPQIPVYGANTQLVDRKQISPFQLLKSSSIYVENNSSIEQEGHTEEQTTEESSSFEFTMGQTVGMTASGEFGIPLVAEGKIEVSAGFSFGETWTSSRTKSITFPSQTVKVPPKSRIQLTFSIYQGRFSTNYLGNFTMDPNQPLIRNCISKLNQGYIELKLDPKEETLKAIFTTTQQSVFNMPIKFDSDGYQTDIHISDAEPILAPINDASIRRVSILDLKSINKFN